MLLFASTVGAFKTVNVFFFPLLVFLLLTNFVRHPCAILFGGLGHRGDSVRDHSKENVLIG